MSIKIYPHEPDRAKVLVSTILTELPEVAPAVAVVLQEFLRARQKHPDWPTDPIHAVNIITEEVGELAMAANDFYWQGRGGMADEAIQSGAMSIRFLLHLNSYRGLAGRPK
jgi:hypothetical protein